MKIIFKLWPLIIVFLFGLTPLLWFYNKGNVLINGIDTNFPLDPESWFLRRFYVWNSISNAGSDFSSSTAGLFFHLIQYIPYKIGFNLQQVQIITLVFWFCLIVFGAYIFARVIFTKKPLVQLLFVSLYSFNIYLYNSWENVKVANLSLVAAIPYALTLLILLRQKVINTSLTILSSFFVGIILSGAGINPAYFFTFFIIISIYLLAEIVSNFNKQFIFLRIKHLLIVFIPLFLVNLFWLLPTVFFISHNISPTGSLDKIGFTNWTGSLSENTSILNVLRLQGAWDWYPVNTETNTPYYIPYASNYFYNFPFILFSLLLPLLALLSLLRLRKDKIHLYLAFGVMLVMGVFLGTGTHAPTGSTFSFLLDHLPFFTLFRSPWYIFTPLTVMAVAGLISLLFYDPDNSETFSFKMVSSSSIASFIIIIFIIGNFFYSYPLISGKIFRPGRPDSFYVQFPDYVFGSKELMANAPQGRVVSYPDSEVENFQWGYRGIETILQLLVDRETLFMPLNMRDSAVASLLQEFYSSLKKGEIISAQSLAGKLNISLIFNKNDQIAQSYDLDPFLKDQPSWEAGKWVFSKFPNGELTSKIFTTDDLFFSYPYQKDQPFFSTLKSTDLVLNHEDDVVRKIPLIDKISGSVILAQNSQLASFLDYKTTASHLSNRLLSRDLSEVIFNVEFMEDKIYQPVLERYKLEDFDIDTSKGVEIEINGKRDFWTFQDMDDSFAYFYPVFFPKGKYQMKMMVVNKNLVEQGSFSGEIGFTKGGEGKGEGLYEILESKEEDSIGKKEKFLSITNINKADIAAIFKLSSFDPLSDYYIEAKYRQVYGNHAQILITQWDQNKLLKVGKETMPNYPEWRLFSFYYDPVRAASDLYIELTAPYIKDPFGTTVLFDDIKAYRIFTNKLIFFSQNNNEIFSTPQITFKKISPALYEAEVEGADRPHIIVFSENYSPFWKLFLYDSKGKKIKVDPRHFSANLYANAWYLEGTPQNYKVKISYYPQELFKAGLKITTGTLFFALLSVLILFIRRRRLGL